MRATRTYLELTTSSGFRPAFGPSPDVTLARVLAAGATPELYRHCYRSVGEAFHWRDRWNWGDEQIRAHLADPAISLYVARRIGGGGEALVGWFGLGALGEDAPGDVASFGPVPAHLARGTAQTRVP